MAVIKLAGPGLLVVIIFASIVPAMGAQDVEPRMARSVVMSGTGNDSSGPVIEQSDPRGDVVYETGAGNRPAGDGWDDVDLLNLWIGAETSETFQIGVTLAAWSVPGLASGNVPRLYARAFYVFLTVDSVAYRVAIEHPSCPEAAALQSINPATGQYATLQCLETSIDEASGSATMTVRKADLVDSSGHPVGIGHSVEEVYATARRPVVYGGIGFAPSGTDRVFVFDRVPDFSTLPDLVLAMGDHSLSDVEVRSPDAVRFSNGESTTLVFKLILTNSGNQPRELLFSVEDLEPTWKVRLPVRTTVEPKATLTVPVIVSTEFTHRHGETSLFYVVVSTTGEGAESQRVPLGVSWPAIPQPAGHHDTLHFHSKPAENPNDAFSGHDTWVNTLDNDPDVNATDSPVRGAAFGRSPDGVRMVKHWSFPLEPPLRMGLHVDLEGVGEFEAAIRTTAPDPSAWLQAALLYCDPEDPSGLDPGMHRCAQGSWKLLMEGRSDAASMAANSERVFAFHVLPSIHQAVVPYQKGSNLRVGVWLHSLEPFWPPLPDNGGSYLIVKGASLQLPLFEYRDPLDQEFETGDALDLVLRGAAERLVNPGKAVGFPLTLVNKEAQPRVLRLSLEGHNADWGRWSPAADVRLAAHEGRDLSVLVSVPAFAQEGERAEIFAIAEDGDDPAVVALVRLRAQVTHAALPDEPLPLEAEAQTRGIPAPGALALLVGLACAVGQRFRRRTEDG